MELNDVEQASKSTRDIMLDAYELYEKGYYPIQAVEFDISNHSSQHYYDALKQPDRFVYVAEENGVIIGMVSGRLIGESGLARIGWLGVLPTHQCKGNGRELLERAIRHCKVKGCHKITLYTMQVLEPAITLYIKCGFVPEAYLYKEWWGVNFIKMSKWL
jgi:ribosomal protein S18 acetylase RimI-like enzyme